MAIKIKRLERTEHFTQSVIIILKSSAQPIATGKIVINKLRHFMTKLRPPLTKAGALQKRRQLLLIAEHATAGLDNLASHIGCCSQRHFVLQKASIRSLGSEHAQTSIQRTSKLLF